jgi:hypothetical protein
MLTMKIPYTIEEKTCVENCPPERPLKILNPALFTK